MLFALGWGWGMIWGIMVGFALRCKDSGAEASMRCGGLGAGLWRRMEGALVRSGKWGRAPEVIL